MALFQEIVAFIVLGIALFYLYKKFFWKKKNKKSCGEDDCGCH
ncbi:FeoB-associated Cys-rich membrane protein [Flavobacterium sp.]|nr:FeoB-associated Cys-rich membrane protein [Flavobacterium sp.]MDD2985676.1 FeoB-associated Cys-rich membrane protein [Flavobacterium sp.]